MTKLNKFIKFIVTAGALFATNVFAYGHLSEDAVRQHAARETAELIVLCWDDQECVDDGGLSELSENIIRAARWASACWDLSGCRDSSIRDFITVCESNLDCNQTYKAFFDSLTSRSQECIIDPECKAALQNCMATPKCKAIMNACVSQLSMNNPACEEFVEFIPEDVQQRMLDTLDNALGE